MKRISALLLALLAACSINVQANDQQLKQAYQNHQSDFQIQGSGTVSRVLP